MLVLVFCDNSEELLGFSILTLVPSTNVMARKRNSSNKNPADSEVASGRAKVNKVTIDDLAAMSSSDDDGEMPPEESWGSDAKELKARIESGVFDELLSNDHDRDDNESIEEVSLDDESSENDDDASIDALGHIQQQVRKEDNESISSQEDGERSSDDNGEERREEKDLCDDDGEMAESDDEDDDNGGVITESTSKKESILVKNNVSSKAMRFVTELLRSEKRGWAWAETFDVTVKTPLPFGVDAAAGQVSVHDDLKREVAFYDIALEAVIDAKKTCAESNIPFSRPDDFFAEMVKTDGKCQKTVIFRFFMGSISLLLRDHFP